MEGKTHDWFLDEVGQVLSKRVFRQATFSLLLWVGRAGPSWSFFYVYLFVVPGCRLLQHLVLDI